MFKTNATKSKNGSYDEQTMRMLWKNLANRLENYEYWSTTLPASWDVTAFDTSLLKKAYNSKRMAHAKLKADADTIQVTFPKHNEIQKGVKHVRDALAKISHSQDNEEFWTKIAPALNTKSQLREIENPKTEGSSQSVKNSSNTIVSSFVDSQFGSEYPNKKQKILAKSPPSEQQMQVPSTTSTSSEQQNTSQTAQVSMSTPNTITKTITSVIKEAAETIFEKVIQGENISSHERKIMTNGLSSILDLSDDSPYSQQLYFSADEWKTMTETYTKIYSIEEITFPRQLKSIFKIVCFNIKMTRKISAGVKYLYEIYPKYFDDENMFGPLKVFESVLSALDETGYLFEKQDIIDISEYDYLGNVWLPILRILFKKSNIRIKTHESTFNYSTDKKKQQYPQAKNIVGFKIDIRLLVDHEKNEHDLCSGEMAKMDDDDKIMSDRAKVNREAKDDLDSILEYCDEHEWVEKMAWIFQSSGASCRLNSIHLVGNGLYVVLPRFNLKFPNTIDQFDKIYDIIVDLYSWRLSMYQASDFIRRKVKKIHNLSKETRAKAAPHNTLQRDTTYSPPDKATWKKPDHLYGYVPTNVTEKLLQAFHSSQPAPSTVLPSTRSLAMNNEELTYDSNGWAKVGDKYYNRILGEYWDECPYKE